MTDEQLMLIVLCRAYLAAKEKFGQIGQPTFMRFPSIQGFRQRKAVEDIAAAGPESLSCDAAAVAERIVKAAGGAA